MLSGRRMAPEQSQSDSRAALRQIDKDGIVRKKEKGSDGQAYVGWV